MARRTVKTPGGRMGAFGAGQHGDDTWQNHQKKGTIVESAPVFDNKAVGSTPADELLTISQAAGYLNISVSSLRRLQQQRHVPFIKVGGSVRFAMRDIVAYVAAHRVEPIAK